MYLVYKTDVHHSYASRDIIGIAEDPFWATEIVKQQVEKEGEKLSQDDLYNLHNIKQTQNYEGEGEFDYEEIEINTLL